MLKFSVTCGISALCAAMLLAQSAYALEKLDDGSLASATGEGIALLPENFSMQFNGTDNTVGTGYMHLIPVGPLSLAAMDTNKNGTINSTDTSVGKGDVYVYGVALSQSNKDYAAARNSTDTNMLMGRNVDSWGSAVNPWLLRVITEKNVPDFAAATPSATSSGDVSYISLEAPLFHADTDNNLTNGVNAGIVGLGADKSAYNLKMGLWSDILVRDPTKAEGAVDQFNLGTNFNTSVSGRANRLRLQGVWDGLSVNGSSFKVFQTLAGVTGINGTSLNTQGLSTSYNNTLGLAGVVRLNSGDGQTLRATYTDATTNNMVSSGANAVRTQGAYSTPTINGIIANGCGNNDISYGVGQCEYNFRQATVTDAFTKTSQWKAPGMASVLRLSTRETANTSLIDTPALTGTAKPNFDANEGLYLYNPNINLVLGSLYQPLTFGANGNNIIIELARIPNKASIFNKMYTNYDNEAAAANFTGSTCNIYTCGSNGISGYQGNNATHSSITIGSTEYDAAKNLITAHKGLASVGLSFGALGDTSTAAGIGSMTYTRYQDQQRQLRIRYFDWTDQYQVDCQPKFGNTCGSNPAPDPYTGIQGDCSASLASYACNRSILNNGNKNYISNDYNCGSFNKRCQNQLGPIQTTKGTHFDWAYRTSGNADNGTFSNTNGAYTNAEIAVCKGNGGSSCDLDTSARDFTNVAAPTANRDWSTGRTDVNWADITTTSAAVLGVTPPVISATPYINTSPTNNFGSAVIDGLLIQHLKITTKGL